MRRPPAAVFFFLITLLYDALKQGTSPICPLKKQNKEGSEEKLVRLNFAFTLT